MKNHFEKSTDLFKFTAKISDDKMKMFVDVEPTGKNEIRREVLLGVISEFLSPDDVNTGVIDDICKHLTLGEAVLERRIAKGQEAEPGLDGKLLLLAKKFTGEGHVQVDERGYANYSDLHLFDNIAIGQAIGRLYPPKEGKDGFDVLHNLIKAPLGKPAVLALDKSLELRPPPDPSEPYQLIVSNTEGLLAEEQGKLAVKEELVIKGDLDFHYGSIDFIGKVRVTGDVHQGFVIKARKGICIDGSLEGANLTCTDGDILIKGSILGGRRTRLVCSGDVKCKRAQETEIEAHGNITIEKEAIDCNLRSGSTIFALNQLMGGESFVVCGAEAKFLGNDALKQTSIHLCSEVETTTEFSRLLVGISSHDKAIQLVELHLGPYASRPERIELLQEPHKAKMKKLLAKMQEIQKSRISLLGHKKKMLEHAVANDVLRVNILGKIYPGVSIISGDQVFSVKDELVGPKSIDFDPVTNQFSVGELKALQCAPGKSKDKDAANSAPKEKSKADQVTEIKKGNKP